MSRTRQTPRKVKPETPRKIKPLDELRIVHPHAAGLDIGAEEIWACVPVASTAEPVRVFGPFTADLQALADWLITGRVDTVAMESTGVYWIPIFESLEARGLTVFLVNSWHLRHVPGRKSDVLDCQWIQQLHSLGLLRGSFRPDAEMCAVRTRLRHRAMLIEHRSPHILHLQKALLQMNLQLPAVISDVMGETGQAIIRAIVAGERDPLKLARLRFPGCKSSEDDIAQALTSTWQPEHLFALKQNLQLVDYYTQILRECDAELEQRFAAIKPRWDAPAQLPKLPKAKRGSRSKNQPTYNARAELYRITGVCCKSAPHCSHTVTGARTTVVGCSTNDRSVLTCPGWAPRFLAGASRRLTFQSRDGGCDELREFVGGFFSAATSASNWRTRSINCSTSAINSGCDNWVNSSAVGREVMPVITRNSQKSREQLQII